MMNNRPSILIYTVNVDDYLMITEMCAGIEEEGLLYEVKKHHYGVLDELTYNAANESTLGKCLCYLFMSCSFTSDKNNQ